MSSKIKINLDSLKSRREWKRHKVKDGHNVFRLLPPFGESSNGYPYRKWQIIWGLTDPESGRARPFASSMTSEKRCPVTEYVAQLKTKADTLESQFKAAGASEDDIRVRLKDLRDLIGNMSPKTVYIYNAADKSGEVGLLELKSTAHKKVKDIMNQYINDYNQDPTSLNSAEDDSGVWIDVTRTGLGFKTEYDAKKCQTKQKTASGGVSFVDDRSPLPAAVVENYDNLAYDLGSVYQLKSYEQLEDILAANMDSIINAVPDADLTAQSSLEAAPAATRPVVGAGKVAIKLDDEDSEDDIDESKLQGAPVRQPAPLAQTPKKLPVSSAVMDDAFMAEADAILNG